jgi:dTMP kinase
MRPKKPMNSSSKYIAFEGIDASGKTTQAELFCQYLKNLNKTVYCTKEPGGLENTKVIRQLLLNSNIPPKAKLFLFLADRNIHISQIKQWLQNGFVVSDRSMFSTIAYQGFGDGFDLSFIEKANVFAAEGIMPDVTFVIDINLDTMDKRLFDRDAIESKPKSYFEKVRQGYRYVANHYDNIFIINGEKGIEEIFGNILDIWKQI